MLEKWSTDHSFGYPYPNATAMYNGTAGDYRIYLHEFKTCLKFEFGMGIQDPMLFLHLIQEETTPEGSVILVTGLIITW